MNLDTAIFYTNDISNIIRFYRDILNFHLDDYNGDYYASFSFSNGVKLGIKKANEDRENPGAQTVIIAVADGIEELYKTMREKDIPIYKDLTIQEWGKNFAILDPDKNKVEFVERLEVS